MTDTLPASFLRHDLEVARFIGWRTWDELRAGALDDVPCAAGSYIVYRPSAAAPGFVEVGTGGRFKGRDPNVPITTLAAAWVPETQIVYIGKGDDLRQRLRTYARFGAREPVGHWGGRYIWQLADAAELLVAWRELDDAGTARNDERGLLERFAELHHGQRPFANLTG